MTNNEEDLDRLQVALEAQIRPYLNAHASYQLPEDCAAIAFAFNPSEGLFADLLESARQLIEADPSVLWDYWAWFNPLPTLPTAFEQALLNEIETRSIESVINDQWLRRHVNDYINTLAGGQRVVVLAHSQGNLYANKAFRELPSEYQEFSRFNVVALASPASEVAGGGPAISLGEDLAAAVIFKLANPSRIDPLYSNVPDTCAVDLFLPSLQCHTFDNYVDGRNSGPKILEELLKFLIARNEAPTAGFTMKQIGFVLLPPEAHEGETLTVVATATGAATIRFVADRSDDVDGSVAGWEWTVDGVPTSTANSFDKTLAPGLHTVNLLVIDELGARSQPVHGTINVTEAAPNLPPTAGFTMTAEGLPPKTNGETLTVTVPNGSTALVDIAASDCSPGPAAGCSYDHNGHIANRAWTIDGVPSFVFGDTLLGEFSLGVHTVTLVVTDDNGQSSQLVLGTISVVEVSPPVFLALHIDARANLWGAAGQGAANFGGGIDPPGVTFTAAPGQVLTFSNVTGSTQIGCGGPSWGPDGDLAGSDGFVPARGQISGVNYNRGCSLPLFGVFIGPSLPATPPASLDFTEIGHDFPNLSPELGQPFFIGDGLTGTGSGETQRFHVPAGATRLYLGVLDGPGFWDDNSGALDATFSIRVTIDDSFNDNFLDPNRWFVTIGPPGAGTVAETNQRLEVTLNPGAANVGVRTACSMTGDFDVQVDFSLLNWSSDNRQGLSIGTVDLGQGSFGLFRIERFSEGGDFYHMMSPNGVGPSVETSDTSGTLRLVRTGSTLQGYYRDGANFILIGSASVATTQTRFSLNGGLFRNDALGAFFAFDNFKVNTGTVNCP